MSDPTFAANDKWMRASETAPERTTGGQPGDMCLYMKWSRHDAMAHFIVHRWGLEVPICYDLPQAKVLPPVNWSVCIWPERVLVITNPAWFT